jgi:hypothetical protein
MLIPVTSTNRINDLRGLPVLAIDMGFSGKTASCGLAFRNQHGSAIEPKNYKFNDCALRAAEILASNMNSVMILEAPLSAAFNSDGNPQSRGDFEAAPKPRWWSIGPGAAISLAAMYFLRELCQRVPNDIRCNLVEGFVTGVESGNHADVAESLLNNLWNLDAAKWHQPNGSTLVSILDWIEPSSGPHACPIVLIPASR